MYGREQVLVAMVRGKRWFGISAEKGDPWCHVENDVYVERLGAV
jgi:hypothetical protein